MTPAALIEPPQHMHALARANDVRLARAVVKRGVAAGAITAAEVILDPPGCTLTMTVAELLASQRQWGRDRSARLLAAADLREQKTVGSLTERQRRALAAMLR